VLIADAPPHGLGARGDSFPSGCPLGIDPLQVVKEMARKGITLYSVGCEPAITPYRDFFSAIAFATGGQYVPLRNAKLLSTVIVGGALEEMSLEKLMKQVQVGACRFLAHNKANFRHGFFFPGTYTGKIEFS